LILAHEEVLGRRRGGGGIKKNLFPLHFQSTYNIQGLTALLPWGGGGKQYGAWATEYYFKTLRGANKETVCIF
jgi:hypothetical protein